MLESSPRFRRVLWVGGFFAIAGGARPMLAFGIGMIAWVSASQARAAFRTGRGLPLLTALATIPAALFLIAILLHLLAGAYR